MRGISDRNREVSLTLLYTGLDPLAGRRVPRLGTQVETDEGPVSLSTLPPPFVHREGPRGVRDFRRVRTPVPTRSGSRCVTQGIRVRTHPGNSETRVEGSWTGVRVVDLTHFSAMGPDMRA